MKDGSRQYLCDGKPVDYTDAFGALCGKDNIPPRVKSFGGIGDGLLRRAWESEDEYLTRVNKEN